MHCANWLIGVLIEKLAEPKRLLKCLFTLWYLFIVASSIMITKVNDIICLLISRRLGAQEYQITNNKDRCDQFTNQLNQFLQLQSILWKWDVRHFIIIGSLLQINFYKVGLFFFSCNYYQMYMSSTISRKLVGANYQPLNQQHQRQNDDLSNSTMKVWIPG